MANTRKDEKAIVDEPVLVRIPAKIKRRGFLGSKWFKIQRDWAPPVKKG